MHTHTHPNTHASKLVLLWVVHRPHSVKNYYIMTIDLVCHSDIRIFKILWVVPISSLDQGELNESKQHPNKRTPKRMAKYKGDLKYLS